MTMYLWLLVGGSLCTAAPSPPLEQQADLAPEQERQLRRRAQIKQLAWPMAERQIEHRKSRYVLYARFPVVNWRSRPVAKSA